MLKAGPTAQEGRGKRHTSSRETGFGKNASLVALFDTRKGAGCAKHRCACEPHSARRIGDVAGVPIAKVRAAGLPLGLLGVAWLLGERQNTTRK